MKRSRVALNTELQAGAEAPRLVELVVPDSEGRVTGRDGRAWRMTRSDADSVVAAFQARNAALPIDWEHASQHRAPKGEPTPAAAWIEGLQVREDGALLGQVSWTERGANQVQQREYRYLSPVFDFEPATGRIARLVCAGLTNLPNLHLQALNTEEPAMSRSALLIAAITALGLKADADDDAIATAINAARADRDDALSRATNAEKAQPELTRYVPRADYDALAQRATNAENALRERDEAAHKAAVDAAIGEALKAGKITPATEGYHRASCTDAAGLERFKEFVGAAPAIGDPSATGDRKPPGTGTALNAEEQAACKALGISEAEFRASKESLAPRQ